MSDEYITWVLDQLAGLGPLRVKRMFGGAGIYCDELFFAILAEDELYLKVDDRNRGDFERLGLGPFTYVMKNGRSATMNYYPVPADIMENPEQLHAWARKALDAALRARTARRS
ncbi:MAG: TfoX/Sxy family protein [Pseudomonadota bacterium]|nr:TfoX/Sxy family protein [Pseudomonadota bacterium]